MSVLTDKKINEVLDKLDDSIIELAKGALDSIEFQGNFEEVKNFFSNQYEIRLQNILEANNTSIHHLESGIKNRIIQRKQKTLENIAKLFQI
ncbi:hypothetical protein Nlim_0630 [Candidatus Nitrosarchaeum limnium SFB1]|jgi:hypothetical protein|uniref:Uncharacterized protein n=1 Tax=Candidatus Nitrosarchaeum limnium SFB1 TaxID=886738 RepID=F3KJH2_9ARCH|nr:hypothetical protein Nlim_0630 [Candidatus Nitrosarchaeum limnium SFB1]